MTRNSIALAAACALAILALLQGCGEEITSELTNDGGTSCNNTTFPTASEDPDNRIYVAKADAEGDFSFAFPPADASWQLQYKFKVPPLPCSTSWNNTNQVFYIWGDVDFDQYDSNGDHPLSDYSVNQIVPSVMVGNAQARE